jgi:hypothetical protein
MVARLAARTGPATHYASVADLVRTRRLSTVSVLIFHFHPQPKGTLLATLGRMNVEYPGMQKVAVLDEAPPLPIAEYLTACGVSLLWNGTSDESADRLAAVVNQLHERTPWIAS